nr:hypothetical protein TetV2_00487 [Oceanusvirus sp.]
MPKISKRKLSVFAIALAVAVAAAAAVVVAMWLLGWFGKPKLVFGKPTVAWVDGKARATFKYTYRGFPRRGSIIMSTSINPDYYPAASALKRYVQPKKQSSPITVWDPRPDETIYLFVMWVSDDGKHESEMQVLPFETGTEN